MLNTADYLGNLALLFRRDMGFSTHGEPPEVVQASYFEGVVMQGENTRLSPLNCLALLNGKSISQLKIMLVWNDLPGGRPMRNPRLSTISIYP